MPIYSFGKTSPLKFELSDEYADAFNRGVKAFFDAQLRFKEEHGTEWVPSAPIWMDWDEEAMTAFNAFNDILQKALGLHGRPVMVEDIHDDYLIKN